MDGTERRIALFIDFENLVTNTGINPATFDLRPSLDLLLERGKVIYRRAYCDWSRFKEAKASLHEHGVELIDVPPSTRAGKNSADIRLVIDALELAYARSHIDTFVIASGDSDFCPLAHKLRENDKRVIGLAVKQATSPFFVRACDEFLYLPTGGRSGGRATKEREPAAKGRGRGASGGGGGGGGGGDRQPKGKVPTLAREVVESMLARATGPLNPSLIKETMVRKEPDFDEREHGFATFSRLLQAMEKEGLLKRQQQGRQWYVVPADTQDTPPEHGPSHDDHGGSDDESYRAHDDRDMARPARGGGDEHDRAHLDHGPAADDHEPEPAHGDQSDHDRGPDAPSSDDEPGSNPED